MAAAPGGQRVVVVSKVVRLQWYRHLRILGTTAPPEVAIAMARILAGRGSAIVRSLPGSGVATTERRRRDRRLRAPGDDIDECDRYTRLTWILRSGPADDGKSVAPARSLRRCCRHHAPCGLHRMEPCTGTTRRHPIRGFRNLARRAAARQPRSTASAQAALIVRSRPKPPPINGRRSAWKPLYPGWVLAGRVMPRALSSMSVPRA